MVGVDVDVLGEESDRTISQRVVAAAGVMNAETVHGFGVAAGRWGSGRRSFPGVLWGPWGWGGCGGSGTATGAKQGQPDRRKVHQCHTRRPGSFVDDANECFSKHWFRTEFVLEDATAWCSPASCQNQNVFRASNDNVQNYRRLSWGTQDNSWV